MTDIGPGPSLDSRHLSLPFAPESVGVARHALEEWLADALGDTYAIEDCRLVLSELVGNAVRHAQPLADGTMHVDWSCADHELSVAVSDGGSETRPRRIDAELTDLAGRGLAIVEALTKRWWIDTDQTATTVHAVVPLS